MIAKTHHARRAARGAGFGERMSEPGDRNNPKPASGSRTKRRASPRVVARRWNRGVDRSQSGPRAWTRRGLHFNDGSRLRSAAPPAARRLTRPAPERAHERRDRGITKRRRDVVHALVRMQQKLARGLEAHVVEYRLERGAGVLEAAIQR